MTRLRLVKSLLLLALLIIGSVTHAAEPAVLIADEIFVDTDGILIAQGNVEAHQGPLSLTANKVIYDPNADKLNLEGPIRLQDDAGAVIFAEQAELDPQLVEGIMLGARLVLNDQLQLAAVELSRSEGRYTQLYKTVATSCRICGSDSPPIWQIRAQKVVHDAEEQQLYFEKAQFLVLGVPVAIIPQLRMPDPTLDRSTGLLVPSGRSSSLLGAGFKLPYFVAIGDSKDVTFTPYLSDRTSTLEWRYRQVFTNGNLNATGAISSDALVDHTRAYVIANGHTSLNRGYEMVYDLELTSDPSYLLDYGYSGKDRLDSAVSVQRVTGIEYISSDFVYYRTLRDYETNETQPTTVASGLYERKLDQHVLGGELKLRAEAVAHLRTSTTDIIGRDIARLRAEAEWQRTDVLNNGLVFEQHALLDVSSASVAQDSTSDDYIFNISPGLYANVRWPLSAQSDGSSYLLEPVMQIAWSDTVNEIPNEESTLVEFDESNLLDFSRFPASDRVEEGLRLALGTNWTRFDDNGSTTRLSLGRVLRQTADADHTKSSGLQGQLSDWLVAGQFSTQSGLELTSRALFDKNVDVSKSESALTWGNDWGRISATHIWLTADVAEGRSDPLSEIDLSARVYLSRHWTGQVDWQYDLADERIVRTGVGIEYQNECIDILLSASRRFTSSTTVDPSTDYDFRFGLRGFGAGRGGADVIRKCGR